MERDVDFSFKWLADYFNEKVAKSPYKIGDKVRILDSGKCYYISEVFFFPVVYEDDPPKSSGNYAYRYSKINKDGSMSKIRGKLIERVKIEKI